MLHSNIGCWFVDWLVSVECVRGRLCETPDTGAAIYFRLRPAQQSWRTLLARNLKAGSHFLFLSMIVRFFFGRPSFSHSVVRGSSCTVLGWLAGFLSAASSIVVFLFSTLFCFST